MMHRSASAASMHVVKQLKHGAFVRISSIIAADGSSAFPTPITSAIVHAPVYAAASLSLLEEARASEILARRQVRSERAREQA